MTFTFHLPVLIAVVIVPYGIGIIGGSLGDKFGIGVRFRCVLGLMISMSGVVAGFLP